MWLHNYVGVTSTLLITTSIAGRMGGAPRDQCPHNHYDFDYEVPYKTRQEVRDRLLNHKDVLAKENRRLRQQLHEQNTTRRRLVNNNILRAAPPYQNVDQSLPEVIRRAKGMP